MLALQNEVRCIMFEEFVSQFFQRIEKKSTNRCPKTNYFAHGHIKFQVKKDVTYFTIYLWNETADNVGSIYDSKVKDQAELEFLTKKNITFDELSQRYKILESQSVTKEMLS